MTGHGVVFLKSNNCECFVILQMPIGKFIILHSIPLKTEKNKSIKDYKEKIGNCGPGEAF